MVIAATGGKITVTPLPTCTDGYLSGTEVTLTAAPDQGYRFVQWGEYMEGTIDNPTKLVMTEDVSIAATFENEESPLWSWVIIGIAAALGIAVLAYFVRRRLVLSS